MKTVKNLLKSNETTHLLRNLFRPSRLILFFWVVLTFLACKDKDPEPETSLIANAGPDQQVSVMDIVQLDASASTYGSSESVVFKWEVVRKPANSSPQLTNSGNIRANFVADAGGEYEIQVTLSEGGKSSSDKVVVVATPLAPVVIDKDIVEATVLEDRMTNPDFPDYIVSRDVGVKKELVLKPGVVIAFARDARFTIADNGGVLIAKGTSEQKIRFIGVESIKGYWAGIMLNSPASNNILEHAEILHAGSQTMLDGSKMALAMFIESQITINNCLFSSNDGYGLFIQDGAVLKGFAGNVFSANTGAGIRIPADNVASLDQQSVFSSGNGRNVVEVIGPFLGSQNVREEIMWKGFEDGTPYRLMNRLAVRTGWRISPGVTIEVSGDGAIIVNEEAYMVAKGTAASRIKFTGSSGTPAYWAGILIHSQNQQNLIEYAEVSNAGSVPLVSDELANVAIYGDGARIAIRNCRISGSGGYGICVGYGSSINDDLGNTNIFSDNKSGAVLEHFRAE